MKSKTKGLEMVLAPWGRIVVIGYHHMISYSDVWQTNIEIQMLYFHLCLLDIEVNCFEVKCYGFVDVEKAHTSFEIKNGPPRTWKSFVSNTRSPNTCERVLIHLWVTPWETIKHEVDRQDWRPGTPRTPMITRYVWCVVWWLLPTAARRRVESEMKSLMMHLALRDWLGTEPMIDKAKSLVGSCRSLSL